MPKNTPKLNENPLKSKTQIFVRATRTCTCTCMSLSRKAARLGEVAIILCSQIGQCDERCTLYGYGFLRKSENSWKRVSLFIRKDTHTCIPQSMTIKYGILLNLYLDPKTPISFGNYYLLYDTVEERYVLYFCAISSPLHINLRISLNRMQQATSPVWRMWRPVAALSKFDSCNSLHVSSVYTLHLLYL